MDDKAFIGYCPYCEKRNDLVEMHESDIVPAYKGVPQLERKYKCPICKKFVSDNDLIPF